MIALAAVGVVVGLVACSGKEPETSQLEKRADPPTAQIPKFEDKTKLVSKKRLDLRNRGKVESPVPVKVVEADHNEADHQVFDKSKGSSTHAMNSAATFTTLGGGGSGGGRYASRYGAGGQRFNTESYDGIVENEFHSSIDNPLSTFSIDVDTASYSNVRRFLTNGRFPPKGAVRVEELINYFSYDYPDPEPGSSFSVTTEVAACPWTPGHKLVHIGIQGRKISNENVPPRNLVFLLDVSGSMNHRLKLPLLKSAMSLLVENLREEDRVAIVVYASASGLVLPSTPGNERGAILGAIQNLRAGGSTNGGQGIRLAYRIAQANFIRGGINRILLATDGDFNLGTTSNSELATLMKEKRKSGVFLTVLGFGTGNYKDARMEKLADKGNGNYAYIDTLQEARKVLVKEAGATLVTIAKDVKIQVEFNPAHAQAYRLVGYENRILKAKDFNDDRKDAGEIGAGHSVTAIYEVIPPGVEWKQPGVDALKYREEGRASESAGGNELLTLKIRFKQPDGNKSSKITLPVNNAKRSFARASDNFRFSAAVAAFGMRLRESPHGGTLTLEGIHEIARTACGDAAGQYRREFLTLVKAALKIKNRGKGTDVRYRK